MSTLIDRRSNDGAAPYVTGIAEAVMREIVQLLDRLVSSGKPGMIDLHSLPMTDADRELLRRRLGEGEVAARLKVAGASTVEETGIAGVWWVRHEGNDGRLAAEIIEITRVPDILMSHVDDIKESKARLTDELGGTDDVGAEEIAG